MLMQKTWRHWQKSYFCISNSTPEWLERSQFKVLGWPGPDPKSRPKLNWEALAEAEMSSEYWIQALQQVGDGWIWYLYSSHLLNNLNNRMILQISMYLVKKIITHHSFPPVFSLYSCFHSSPSFLLSTPLVSCPRPANLQWHFIAQQNNLTSHREREGERQGERECHTYTHILHIKDRSEKDWHLLTWRVRGDVNKVGALQSKLTPQNPCYIFILFS